MNTLKNEGSIRGFSQQYHGKKHCCFPKEPFREQISKCEQSKERFVQCKYSRDVLYGTINANKEPLFLTVYVAFCQQIKNRAVMQKAKCISYGENTKS